MTTDIFQAAQEVSQTSASTNQGDNQEVDYIKWATDKFRKDDGTLDVLALAKGKWEADTKFVPQLTNELSEARKEVKLRTSLEDFMDKFEAQRAQQTNTQVTNPDESSTANNASQSSFSTDDYRKVAEEVFTQKQREQIAATNIRKVSEELYAKWGEHTVDKLKSRARELGVNETWLNSIAQQSPKAFLELVLDRAPAAPGEPPSTYVPPRTNTNTTSTLHTNPAGAKTRKEWNDIRRKMKASEYWTPEVQQKILADMHVLGDKFYS